MALTEEDVQDKIEIVGEFKLIQVRTANIIKRDFDRDQSLILTSCIHCTKITDTSNRKR